MAQLSNQDPLNPMEAAQFLDQIAAMNSVKQLMDANSRLDSLLLGMTSLNNESAVDLVGRKVVARADEFSHTAGEAEELLFELGKDSKDVTITVTDESGAVVDTISLQDRPSGEQTVTWDGGRLLGGNAPSGRYSFSVSATDADGNPVESATYVTGIVEELRFDSGMPVLVVDGQEVTLDGILRVLAGGPGDAAGAGDDGGSPPDLAGGPSAGPSSPTVDLSEATLSDLFQLISASNFQL